MTHATRRPLAASFAALLLLLSACSTPQTLGDLGPVHTPVNYRGPAAWPGHISRVAVLPAHDATGRLTAEFTAAHDSSWFRALTATQRAEFILVSRTALATWCGQASFNSTEPLAHDALSRIAARTGAQAVLFLDLTHVTPYPPLKLAFRTRLVTLPDGATLWMADEFYDASDAATARGARHLARANSTGAGDPVASIQQSPSRFADYAFSGVAALLPPRLPTPTQTPQAGTQKSPAADSSPFPAKKYQNRADNTAR